MFSIMSVKKTRTEEKQTARIDRYHGNTRREDAEIGTGVWGYVPPPPDDLIPFATKVWGYKKNWGTTDSK